VIGPVLYQELLLGGRKRRLHLLRWICGALLWLQLCFVYSFALGEPPPHVPSPPAGLRLVLASRAHVELLAWEQFLLILLVTPAFVAGEVTDAKTRGVLGHLLTTDLRSWEILLGKLLAQGLTLAALLSMTVPLLCFSAVCGDLALGPVFAQVAGMALLIFLLGSAGLLASVWCRNTSDAILTLYGAILGFFLAAWGLRALFEHLALAAATAESTGFFGGLGDLLSGLLRLFDPSYLIEPAWDPAESAEAWRRLLKLTLAWGGTGALCLAAAAWRLRPAYARQLELAGKRRDVISGRRPPPGEEAVLWRELYVEGVAPLDSLRRVPRWLAVGLVSTGTLIGMGLLYLRGDEARSPRVLEKYLFHLKVGLVLTGVAALVVGARCATAITREREQRTWEGLLVTPLSTRTIIDEKFRAILWAAFPYLLAYALPALVLALVRGTADLALVRSRETAGPLGALYGLTDFLLTAVWVGGAYLMMTWVASCGLASSARARGSWRSLLATFSLGYYVGLFFGVVPPALLGLGVVLHQDLGPAFFTFTGLGGLVCCGGLAFASFGLVWATYGMVKSNLQAATSDILYRERTWAVPEGMVRGPLGGPRDPSPTP
jgi:ABC-type transport system involved in multi-copper enzyme maturation permease subunit